MLHLFYFVTIAYYFCLSFCFCISNKILHALLFILNSYLSNVLYCTTVQVNLKTYQDIKKNMTLKQNESNILKYYIISLKKYVYVSLSKYLFIVDVDSSMLWTQCVESSRPWQHLLTVRSSLTHWWANGNYLYFNTWICRFYIVWIRDV